MRGPCPPGDPGRQAKTRSAHASSHRLDSLARARGSSVRGRQRARALGGNSPRRTVSEDQRPRSSLGRGRFVFAHPHSLRSRQRSALRLLPTILLVGSKTEHSTRSQRFLFLLRNRKPAGPSGAVDRQGFGRSPRQRGRPRLMPHSHPSGRLDACPRGLRVANPEALSCSRP